MEKLEKLRRLDKINAIVSFQKTSWFPLLLGVLCVLSCTFGFDMAAFYIIAVIGLFTIIVNDDIKTVLPVIIFPYFAAYNRVPSPDINYYLNGYSAAEIVQIIILACVLVAALIVRVAIDGKLKSIFTRRVALTGSIAAVFAALLFNGLIASLTSDKVLYNLMYNIGSGLLIFVCLFGLYYIFTHALKNDKNNIVYLCRLMSIVGGVIFVQLLIQALRAYAGGTLFAEDSFYILRDSLILGWGTPNVIAGMLLVSLPCTLYLTMNHRFPLLSYGLAGLMLAGIIVTQSRSAIYVALAVLVLGTVCCCLKGKNKRFCRYLTAALVGVVMIAFATMGDRTPKFINRVFALDQAWFAMDGETVWSTWVNGWNVFASNSVFGAGFVHQIADAGNESIYYNMYFNMAVQIAACAGILGLLAAAFHAGQVAVLFLRRISKQRCFIGFAIATVVISSMINNYIFYPQFAILYSIFIAFAERDSDFCREKALAEHRHMTAPGGGRRPRVVFTFVEAGLGHITSIRAVADAFEKKYGDAVEVVRSDFFTETGDAELAGMQDFFSGVVKKQNEVRGFGSFMLMSASIFGEWLSHKMTMEYKPSFRRAAKKAVAHTDKLGADILFTTHWATAYYAAKSGRRPFIVSLCPDIKTNIMFRVDSNYLLMCTKDGYDDILRTRRYSENNVKLVPRPIRADAYGYVGKKSEVRAELGIDEDAFVVLIADGGYGRAKMLEVTRELARSKTKMTLIPVAGLSKDTYDELCKIAPASNIDLRPYGYTDDMLKLHAAADLFVGKSGANIIAEAYFYGVPQIITNMSTPIEKDTMKYCRDKLKCAVYEPDVGRAAALVEHFASHPAELAVYSKNAEKHEPFGTDEIVDMLYGILEKQGKVGPFYDDYGETVIDSSQPVFPRLYWQFVARELKKKRSRK